jgi:hypothetical protein
MGKWELGIWEFHLLWIRISMSPEGSNVRNSYRLRLKGFTLLRLHLRLTRLSVRTFHAHEAQHTLMRIPAGFLTKAKSAPSAEFLRLLERLSPLTAENFSALSALSLSCFPARCSAIIFRGKYLQIRKFLRIFVA